MGNMLGRFEDEALGSKEQVMEEKVVEESESVSGNDRRQVS
jgi:hypothetical protein